MTQPTPNDATHSLDLIKHVLQEAAHKLASKCDGDCSNCPCSQDHAEPDDQAPNDETSD